MEIKKTLKELFESRQDELSQQLTGLTLPKDALKVQKTVETFLASLFESDGDYRQSFTQSEDYILQAALQLLQAQQNISKELATSLKGTSTPKSEAVILDQNKGSMYSPIIGAGLGAVAGGFLGTWAAVCCAVAGTAVAIYCTNKPAKNVIKAPDHSSPVVTQVTTIDLNIFCTIIGKICQNIDNLMETYRVQVKRVENIYTQAEKPSLLDECEELFNQLANVYKIVTASKENVPSKVQTAVELLIESLQNYGLTIKDGKIVHE